MSDQEIATVLLFDGQVICLKCLDNSDAVEKRLHDGDTYSGDPCDRCGALSRPESK